MHFVKVEADELVLNIDQMFVDYSLWDFRVQADYDQALAVRHRQWF